MRAPIVSFLQGMAIGAANVIPGVSGGTMALVFGIYDRILGAVGRWGPKSAVDLLRALRSSERGTSLRAFAHRYEVGFLAALGAGAIASVLLLSRLLEHLLENAPEPTYGFFFGLIAVSIVMPWSLLGRKSWPELVSGAIGIALIVGLGMAMSPEDRVDARRTAHEIRSASANPSSASPSSTPDGSARGEESPISSGDASARSDETVPASRTPTTTSRVYEAARFAIAGAIGIAAMILPGLSGSFVLLLLGVYFDVLRAINSWNFPLLFAFAFGCAVGGLLFVRFLSFLIARYRDPTLAFITGLLVGSLWELWPFAKMIAVGDDLLRGEKYLPRIDDATTWITLGAAVLGATILLLSIAWERRMRLARATKDNEASPPAPEAPSPAS